MKIREFIQKFVKKEDQQGELEWLHSLPEKVREAYIEVTIYLRNRFGKD